MKKLLLFALLVVVGCNKYEDKRYEYLKVKSAPLPYTNNRYDTRFDKQEGEKEWYIDDKWMKKEELKKYLQSSFRYKIDDGQGGKRRMTKEELKKHQKYLNKNQ